MRLRWVNSPGFTRDMQVGAAVERPKGLEGDEGDI